MQTVTSADGTGIAYETYGEGPPLILLHGGSSPRFWEPVIPRFSGDHTVVVPHRRGVGASEDGEDYSLERGVEDVRSVVAAVDGDPILFGHSFGGLLALEAARTVPLEGLVAFEPAVLVGEYRQNADLAATMQARLDAGDREGAMKRYVEEVVYDGEETGLDEWLAEWPPWPDIVSLAENVVRINRAIEAYRLPDELEVTAPTLLLTGTEAPSHLRESVRAVQEALPENRLVELDEIGHGGPAEAPDRVAAVVRSHVRGTVPSGG